MKGGKSKLRKHQEQNGYTSSLQLPEPQASDYNRGLLVPTEN